MTLSNLIKKLSVLLIITMWSASCNGTPDSIIFKKHSSSDTKIYFNNRLKIDGELVVLDFEYMFNGAGVAVADFDNDGLQDIYFTGNMVSNRLYKNLGDWNYKDITESSNTGSKDWSNGVTVVDINQDGWKDIYVSKGGPRSSTAKQRANLLFINRGIIDGELQFEEQAALWGLDDSSYSVQSTFFDYDGDGDLDMYLLCNALVDFNRNTSRPKDRNGKAPSKDKLFRNDGSSQNGQTTFTDVSETSGILVEGFGLGVEVCDINLDGWLDVYVSNDFLTDDLLYVNQKDGTFKNEISKYLKHLTFNGMGNDIADINNDGLMDIIVLDMLPPDNKRWKLTMMGNNYDEHEKGLSYGYQPQYIRNTLQINNGNGSFSELGQLAKISATEWSWGPLIADFDNDGFSDLFITNGYRQDITNLDFMVYSNHALTMGTVEANKEARLKELNKFPGIKVRNYLYKNKGDLKFEDVSISSGFDDPTYSNGLAYADLDNDGDLDLIVNNIDDFAGIYENRTPSGINNHHIRVQLKGSELNRDALGSKVIIYSEDNELVKMLTPTRGYLSSVEHTLHFGLGSIEKIDSLKVIWPDGNQQIIKDPEVDRSITLTYSESNISPYEQTKDLSYQFFESIESSEMQFEHQEDYFVDYKIQPLLPHMHSRNGPGIAVADINGDHLEDYFIGGASGQQGALYIQQPDNSFKITSHGDFMQETMGSLFFDADSDGDLDLYTVGGGTSFEKDSMYMDFLYVNDGQGNFSKILDGFNSSTSGSVVTAADYDKDGDLDLFIGGRVIPGAYPLRPVSILLKNDSSKENISFVKDDQPVNDIFNSLGMVTSALWTDFNNDSWVDLIVTGEFMEIRFFENQRGTLEDITEQTGLKNTAGWWNSILGGDFDNDGDIDYIFGNLGLNSRYTCSAEEPLRIYSKDFDKNGQIDPIMSYYIDGENQIAHARNDLIDQIASIRGRFRTYTDYATSNLEESFSKSELRDAFVLKSETFASSYVENLGDGKFKLIPLPQYAQIAPIYGMISGDYNNDGNLDVLAVGNFYSGEVFNGRYDASIGWLMIGDGNGSFDFESAAKSGFYVQADGKGLANLYAGDQELIVVGVNNEKPKSFYYDRSNHKSFEISDQDLSAILTFKDGRIQKREFYYGSGYLSSPSKRLVYGDQFRSIKILKKSGVEIELIE